MKTTRYFEDQILKKRTYLTTEMCIRVINNHLKYEIQADGSLAQTAIGDEADITNPYDGSTTTGLSQCTISTTLAGSGASKVLRIIDIAPYPDNAWGDNYVIVRVQINKYQYAVGTNGV